MTINAMSIKKEIKLFILQLTNFSVSQNVVKNGSFVSVIK